MRSSSRDQQRILLADCSPFDCENGADAVLVEGRRISWVGKLADSPGPDEVINLGGRVLLPALCDSHIHFVNWCRARVVPDLSSCASAADCARMLSKALASMGDGEWLVAYGWNRNLWSDAAAPTRQILDDLSPANPVALWSHDYHTLWVNALALKETGLTRSTAGDFGHEVELDGSGSPSGTLREKASKVFSSRIPKPGREEIKRLMTEGARELHRHGICSIHNFEGTFQFGLLQEMSPERTLNLRVLHVIRDEYLNHALEAGIRSGLGDEWFKVGQAKFFADGALGARTAWLFEPYEDDPHNFGHDYHGAEQLKEDVRRAREGGFACAIHAIGDRACAVALDALESARAASPGALPLPDRIEHAQLVRTEDIPRFTASEIVASMQPSHILTDHRTADAAWGKRCSRAFPLRPLLDSGATLALGTDAPVEPPDPRRNLFSAVVRSRQLGDDSDLWYPELAIEAASAVRAYTHGAVVAAGEALRRGRIRPGFTADLTAISDDILADTRALAQVSFDFTMVGGEIVHSDL